jgi:hypothetical protein
LLRPAYRYTNELWPSHPVFTTPCVMLQIYPYLRLTSEDFASSFQPKSVLIFETVHACCMSSCMSWLSGIYIIIGKVRIMEIVMVLFCSVYLLYLWNQNFVLTSLFLWILEWVL